jgi:hypothetical protein
MRGIAQFHGDRKIEPGRPAAQACDSHGQILPSISRLARSASRSNRRQTSKVWMLFQV